MWKKGLKSLMVYFIAFICFASCAAQTGDTPQRENEQSKEVRWPKEKLKMGEDGVPLLKVYVDGEIQSMDLERYVEGVLAGEMKNDWPMEALKAQAILARTFVLKFIQEKESKYEGADISTDIEEAQAYEEAEVNDRIKKAVRETRGMVLVWNGELPYTWFHSHSGGKTAYAVEGLGWDKKEPEYTAIVDGQEPDTAEGEADNKALQEAAKWEATFSADAFQKACAETGVKIEITSAAKLSIGKRGESGRAITLLVNGQELDAAEFRIAIGSTKMRSTYLDAFEWRDEKIFMSGRGYGHGVGMSQWGAYGMAQAGKTAAEIVQHYFRNTHVEKIW